MEEMTTEEVEKVPWLDAPVTGFFSNQQRIKEDCWTKMFLETVKQLEFLRKCIETEVPEGGSQDGH